jgi:hypothetical protein
MLHIKPPHVRSILRHPIEAFCVNGHTSQLAAGELLPAWCECGEELRETGISREFREQRHRDFEAIIAYELRMERGDCFRLRGLGVKHEL